MNLLKYNLKYIRLADVNGNLYKGYAHYCDKEDYEAKEDGVEVKVGNDIWVFYESDIKSIEILD